MHDAGGLRQTGRGSVDPERQDAFDVELLDGDRARGVQAVRVEARDLQHEALQRAEEQ